ncbi:farnesol dehydrogenase-like [Anabrus simplex]|uniref:farnesol dehydrogenase-like n=1 Tax=Anabrus simplex TaxID=316456 RepID=UPI0035A2B749
MERWAGRVAVVTGASSGIGAAITKDLVRKGLIVVGLDKMEIKIQELDEAPGRLHAIQCDVSEEEEILASFKWIKENLGHVDVLVNNAGVFYESMLSNGNTAEWRKQIDVNILGLAICTREMLKGRGDRDGHIIHINSVAGHYPPLFKGGGIYNATKHAVTSLTENLRKELVELKSKVKVTSVSPGLVKTGLIRRGNIHNITADKVFETYPYLEPEDISDAVLYVLGTPPRVQFYENFSNNSSDCQTFSNKTTQQ